MDVPEDLAEVLLKPEFWQEVCVAGMFRPPRRRADVLRPVNTKNSFNNEQPTKSRHLNRSTGRLILNSSCNGPGENLFFNLVVLRIKI